MVRRNLPVFTIVGDVTLVPGYEVAREAQEAEQREQVSTDWRDALRSHVQQSTGWLQPVTMAPGSYYEDTSNVLSEEFLQDFLKEVKGIMNDPNLQVHVFTMNEDGELVEQDGFNG